MVMHQCPQCELLFLFRTEVEWHVRNDHLSRAATRRDDGEQSPRGTDPALVVEPV